MRPGLAIKVGADGVGGMIDLVEPTMRVANKISHQEKVVQRRLCVNGKEIVTITSNLQYSSSINLMVGHRMMQP